MSTTAQNTIAPPAANPPNAFNRFTAEEFLLSLSDGGIILENAIAIWNLPATNSQAVMLGQVRNVPGNMTIGQLLVHLYEAKVGSEAVQLSIATSVIRKAREAEFLARASQEGAIALQQQAEDAAIAATTAIQDAHQQELAGNFDSDIDDSVRSASRKAELCAEHAQNAAAVVEVREESAKLAVEEAKDTIKKLPTQTRETVIATLAPEFAHLTGDIVDHGDTHPPKPSFSGVPADVVGFACSKCKVYNLVRSGKKDWYSVFVGRKVGIFFGNHRALAVTTGVSGARLHGFLTREEAEEAFAAALLARAVKAIED